ncbi:putative integral membrane protein [Bordetella bronchiseptica Bbr77]|nr:putative integral membrane protein [Bordetella bronchiseptica Bbr77]
MGQQVVITAAHWMYLLGVVVIVITMIFRANVVVPSLLGTLLVGIAFGGSIVSGVTAVFNASFMAAKELFNIFLVIAFMTALLNALKTLGSDVRMVQPFRAVMTNGHIAFVVLALATYLISLFFWPTPAVPLVAAILLPAAIAAGLPPLGAACAIAILPALRGGEAAALVGGAAALLMVAATAVGVPGRDFLNTAADHVTDGFVFAFKAMGSVLPIAGFFFLGAPDQAAGILGVEPGHAPNLLFDLLQAAQGWIPNSHLVVAFGVLIVGVITGIDGSGFSGLPLTGALSGALGATAGVDAATLAAVGQMGAVWTGGGTLVAWSSLIAVAGFARVPVLELVRKLFGPVVLGLIVSTVAAVMFMT